MSHHSKIEMSLRDVVEDKLSSLCRGAHCGQWVDKVSDILTNCTCRMRGPHSNILKAIMRSQREKERLTMLREEKKLRSYDGFV